MLGVQTATLLGASSQQTAPPSGPTVYFYDTFTDAPKVLASHVPDINLFGNTYVAYGTFICAGGQAYGSGGGYNNCTVDAGSPATYKASIDVASTGTNGRQFGIYARGAGGGTSNWVFTLSSANLLSIRENNSISRSSLNVGAKVGSISTQWAGDVVTLLFNGSATAVTYSCPAKGNRWGVFGQDNTDMLDNFKLEL